jgi:hypothetical protein
VGNKRIPSAAGPRPIGPATRTCRRVAEIHRVSDEAGKLPRKGSVRHQRRPWAGRWVPLYRREARVACPVDYGEKCGGPPSPAGLPSSRPLAAPRRRKHGRERQLVTDLEVIGTCYAESTCATWPRLVQSVLQRLGTEQGPTSGTASRPFDNRQSWAMAVSGRCGRMRLRCRPRPTPSSAVRWTAGSPAAAGPVKSAAAVAPTRLYQYMRIGSGRASMAAAQAVAMLNSAGTATRCLR